MRAAPGTRTFENPDLRCLGPRLGFAYRVNDKTTIRGGYGMYYADVAFDQFIGAPTAGFRPTCSRRTRPTAACPPSTWTTASPRTGSVHPPFVDPTFANGGNVAVGAEDGLTLPRFQNWSLTFKRRLTDNMMLDVSYIGNRGSRLNHHWERAGSART